MISSNGLATIQPCCWCRLISNLLRNYRTHTGCHVTHTTHTHHMQMWTKPALGWRCRPLYHQIYGRRHIWLWRGAGDGAGQISGEKIKILIFQQPLISSPMNLARTDKIDKQLQTRNKTTPKVSLMWYLECWATHGYSLYYDNTDSPRVYLMVLRIFSDGTRISRISKFISNKSFVPCRSISNIKISEIPTIFCWNKIEQSLSDWMGRNLLWQVVRPRQDWELWMIH